MGKTRASTRVAFTFPARELAPLWKPARACAPAQIARGWLWIVPTEKRACAINRDPSVTQVPLRVEQHGLRHAKRRVTCTTITTNRAPPFVESSNGRIWAFAGDICVKRVKRDDASWELRPEELSCERRLSRLSSRARKCRRMPFRAWSFQRSRGVSSLLPSSFRAREDKTLYRLRYAIYARVSARRLIPN